MPSNPADDELRSGSQFSLGGVMAVIAVLALALSARLLPILAPRVPLRSSIARSRCDSLKIPSLASGSGPSGGLRAPGLAH